MSYKEGIELCIWFCATILVRLLHFFPLSRPENCEHCSSSLSPHNCENCPVPQSLFSLCNSGLLFVHIAWFCARSLMCLVHSYPLLRPHTNWYGSVSQSMCGWFTPVLFWGHTPKAWFCSTVYVWLVHYCPLLTTHTKEHGSLPQSMCGWCTPILFWGHIPMGMVLCHNL